MKKMLCTAAAALLTTVAMPASAATTILFVDFSGGLGPFTVTPGTVAGTADGTTYASCCGTAPAYTNPFAALSGGGNPGSLTATLATVFGRTYNLSLRVGTLAGRGTTGLTDPLTVTAGLSTRMYSPIANNDLFTGFQTVSFTFLGTGPSTALSFSSGAASPNADAIIDDVLVTAVPEPATWAMMLLGFGMVGFGLRSRKITGRVAYA